jgi:hypothetical protein
MIIIHKNVFGTRRENATWKVWAWMEGKTRTISSVVKLLLDSHDRLCSIKVVSQ